MSRPARFLVVAFLITVDAAAATAQSAPERATAVTPVSASLITQVRIVEGDRLQARTVRELRLVARGEDYDEYAVAVSVVATGAWELALLLPPDRPGSAATTLQVRDALGAWRAIDSSRRTDVVAEGGATREPREVDLRFRIAGTGRRESLAQPRLLLAPALP